MKVVIGTMAMWIWLMILVVVPTTLVISARPEIEIDQAGKPKQPPPPPPAPQYKTVATFDLTKPDTYSTSLQTLRDALASKTKVCDLPVLPEAGEKGKDPFVWVDLKFVKKKETTINTISLGIDAISLYVLGYRDQVGAKSRSSIIQQDTKDQQEVVDKYFQGSDIKRSFPFKGSYKALEDAAGKINRNKLNLGVYSLRDACGEVFGTTPKSYKKEAEFLLIAIQTIAEAARFNYIEAQAEAGAKPDTQVLALETNWGKISEAVHKSATQKPACQTIDTIKLTSNLVLSTISDVKQQVALLKSKKTKKGFGIEAITTDEAVNQL